MGRKYENESIVAYNSHGQLEKSREHDITELKIPYFFKVTVRTSIGLTIDGKYDVHPATTDYQPIKKPFPKEWDIAKYEPVKLKIQNLCAKCEKEGRPRMDKKNKENFHHPKYASNQKEEYRLIFNHKDEDGKKRQCVIASFDKEHGIFNKTGKISKRVEDCFFPNYLLKERNI